MSPVFQRGRREINQNVLCRIKHDSEVWCRNLKNTCLQHFSSTRNECSSAIDLLRITPLSQVSGPPDQSTWMFPYSLIHEWSERVFWYAVWHHYANGLYHRHHSLTWPGCTLNARNLGAYPHRTLYWTCNHDELANWLLGLWHFMPNVSKEEKSCGWHGAKSCQHAQAFVPRCLIAQSGICVAQ